MAMAALIGSTPAPPYASGMLSPSKPSAAPLRTASQLNWLDIVGLVCPGPHL